MMRPVDAPRPIPEQVSYRSLLSPLSADEMTDLMQTPPVETRREPNIVLLRKCHMCREWAREGQEMCCGYALPVNR